MSLALVLGHFGTIERIGQRLRDILIIRHSINCQKTSNGKQNSFGMGAKSNMLIKYQIHSMLQ